MAAPTPAKDLKLNPTDLVFSGAKSKFQEWRDNLALHFLGNPDRFPDDKKKVLFTLSYMTGSNDVRLWKSAKQRQYEAGTWPTWTQFLQQLEADFGDPAADAKAKEYLRTYKQGTTLARKFFSNLELWFALAKIDDVNEQLDITKKSMNPQLRSNLTLVGFPASYSGLKTKMMSLEDEDQKMEPTGDPQTLDSRLVAGPSTYGCPSPATY